MYTVTMLTASTSTPSWPTRTAGSRGRDRSQHLGCTASGFRGSWHILISRWRDPSLIRKAYQPPDPVQRVGEHVGSRLDIQALRPASDEIGRAASRDRV